MERHLKNRLLDSSYDDSSAFPLTPPPSISGDSLARSTPPEASVAVPGYTNTEWIHSGPGEEALDLRTKTSPVILEPVSPPWRPALGKNIDEDSFIHEKQVQLESRGSLEVAAMEVEGMDRAERIAVNALLALSKGY